MDPILPAGTVSSKPLKPKEKSCLGWAMVEMQTSQGKEEGTSRGW